MTQSRDQLRLGNAFYEAQARWNGGGMAGLPLATAPQDTQDRGVPLTQAFYYQMGTASTALASGLFYSASGSATTGSATLTGTGALVTASVGTFDVPRGIRITASVNLGTTTFVIVGTDGYGKTQSHSFVGPTGNTFGNTGSYTDSLVTFKTVTAMSISNPTASGIATTALAIGNNDMYGLPYVLGNVGCGLDVYINGASATVPATWVAAFTPTGVTTASTADVRGSVTLATVVLANGSRYITVGMIAPSVNVSTNNDTKVNSYGATPFAG
jgi:hypothetical protein